MDQVLSEEVAIPEGVTPEITFADLPLSPPVLQALADLGYLTPTPVQAAVVPLALSGLDLIVQAQTGTGKTAAFGLPIVERFSGQHAGVVALAITPTRELALQVAAEVDALGKHKGIRTATVYGGVALPPQVRNIARAQLVVGTPGRLLDHLRRGSLSLRQVEICVIDEADEMLSLGFLEDVESILEHLPEKRQTFLASATMPSDVHRLAERHMVAPEFVTLSSDAVAAEKVQHFYYLSLGRSRLQDLLRVIELEHPENAIVFCNTRADSALVASHLRAQGYDAEVINGDLSQPEREKIMAACKAGKLRFMVATDVAARGIDVSGLSHVINYMLPEQAEMYIHRTGRTGRAGHSGRAISLVAPQEMGSFYFLRKSYALEMVYKELPPEEGRDPFAGALDRALQAERRLAARAARGQGESGAEHPPAEGEGPVAGREEGARSSRGPGRSRMGRREEGAGPPLASRPRRRAAGPGEEERPPRGRDAERRRRAPVSEARHADAPAPAAAAEGEGGRRGAPRLADAVRLHLNAGRVHFPGGRAELKALLVERGAPPASLGRIDLHSSYSFLEVEASEVERLVQQLGGMELACGLVLQLEQARERGAR